MKKYILSIFIIIFYLIFPATSSCGEQQLKVGIYQNPPLQFTDSKGEVKGILVDVLNYVAAREGWSLRYIPGTWNQSLQRLKNKEIDILGAIAFTEQRDAIFDFTKENVLTNWGEVYSRKGSQIHTLLDLNNKKIGVLQNDIHHKALKHLVSEFGIQCDFIETDHYSSVLELVVQEEVDAGVVNRLVGMQSVSKNDLKKSTIIFNPISIHYAVTGGQNDHLLNALDKHIKLLKENERSIYYRSLDQWLNVTAANPRLPQWLKLVIFPGCGVLLFLFLGNMLLRSKVRLKTQELARELAERKQAEELIQFKNTILTTQQEVSLDGIIIIDETRTIVSFNRRFEELWGLSACVLRYGSDEQALKLVLPQMADPDQFVARVEYLYAHRGEHSFEEISLNDGRTFERYSAPMLGANDKYYGRVWYFRDVTERQIAAQALRESEEKYRDLFDSADLLIQSIDANGHFQHVNKNWKETLGYSDEEIAHLTIWDIIHPDSTPHCQIFFGKILAGEKIDAFETVFLSKDGSSIPVEGNSNCRFKNGKPALTRGIFRDIRERKRAEEEKAELEALLYRSQNMEALGTLAGGVAHDLNNILSGIVSYPELLLLDLPEKSPMREPLMTIKKSGDNAASIVQDLLTLARRGVATNDVVNLNSIILDYLASHEFRQLLNFHPKVKVEKQLDHCLLNISGSAVHLSKTVMNLVSNSAEAMPAGGTIRISTENKYVDQQTSAYCQLSEGEYVVLNISDTGIGIPEQDLKRIFEPFYSKKVMGRSGTGLGMAVVWGTVKDHKGSIDVHSQKDMGTKFQLHFPATRKQFFEKSIIPITNYRGNAELILIVDDVQEQRNIATLMLEKLNYIVESVASGEEAIEFIKQRPVDLLVLDMIMTPGMDGFETYQAICTFAPGQKAIIASGFAENDRVKKTQQLGAGSYVRKPYTLEQVGLAIGEELKRVTPGAE
ncbi:MAG: PAS domain S-box protein [Desulfobulbaceae bacterium]|nr:PAS domain S-box protein [Desulfobulbaceae bacterium]